MIRVHRYGGPHWGLLFRIMWIPIICARPIIRIMRLSSITEAAIRAATQVIVAMSDFRMSWSFWILMGVSLGEVAQESH